MNRLTLLAELRAAEATLYQPQVLSSVTGRSAEDRAAFVQMREAIARLVNNVTNAELEALNNALSAQEGAVQGALTELQSAVSDLTDHKIALRRVSTAVGIIAGVAGGVGGFFLQ